MKTLNSPASPVLIQTATTAPGSGRSLWQRTLFMLLFLVIYSIAELLVKTTVLLQLVFLACSGRLQRHLLAFSASLSAYIYLIWRYLTFNEQQLPWPFSAWPKE